MRDRIRAMASDQLQATLQTISDGITAALSGVAKIRAEQWAISEAMREFSPELHAAYLVHTSSDQFLALQSSASYQIGKIAEVLGKAQ